MTYNKETEEINVIENFNLLKVNSLPVSSTFGVFNEKHILADPTEEEEQLCISKLTVVTNGNLIYSLHKPGKSHLLRIIFVFYNFPLDISHYLIQLKLIVQ